MNGRNWIKQINIPKILLNFNIHWLKMAENSLAAPSSKCYYPYRHSVSVPVDNVCISFQPPLLRLNLILNN
jgi:hypothetical protein